MLLSLAFSQPSVAAHDPVEIDSGGPRHVSTEMTGGLGSGVCGADAANCNVLLLRAIATSLRSEVVPCTGIPLALDQVYYIRELEGVSGGVVRGCVVERAARLSSLLEIRGSRVGCRLGGTIPAPGTSPMLMLVPLSDHSRSGSTTPVAEQPAAKEGAADGAAARIERSEASVDRWRSRVAPSFFTHTTIVTQVSHKVSRQ